MNLCEYFLKFSGGNMFPAIIKTVINNTFYLLPVKFSVKTSLEFVPDLAEYFCAICKQGDT